MEVTDAKLFQMIGEKQVQIELLQGQLKLSQEAMAKQVQENNDLRERLSQATATVAKTEGD